MSIVHQAESVARLFHAGQFRRDKVTPYIRHIEDVVRRLPTFREPEIEATAWLHDVIEDTGYPIESLRREFPVEVADAVLSLTKLKNEDYFVYLARVKGNSVARVVKVYDMLSNLNDSPTKAQIRRYAAGLLILV